jgi:hypothetical protein
MKGPSVLAVAASILAFVVSTAISRTLSLPERYCGDRMPILCRKCPEYAICSGLNATCPVNLMFVEGFCTFPDTIEEQALQILSVVRSVPATERAPEKLADMFAVSPTVAAKAVWYANEEPSPKVRKCEWHVSLCCSVLFLALLCWLIWTRLRAMKDQRCIERVVDYLEHSRRTPRSISSIFTQLGITGRTPARKRILDGLQHMPQFDIYHDSMQVVRTM